MERLFEGNIRKNFFAFCLPLVFSAIMLRSNEIIDGIMAGNHINENAFAATNATADFQTLVQCLFWGYSGGASVYIAMLFGKGDYKKMANVIKVNLIVTSIVAVIVCIGFILGYKPMFEILKIPEEIYKETYIFYSGTLMTLVFVNLNCFFVYIYNAINSNRIVFVLSFVSFGLNVLSKYVLIKYCDLGIFGVILGAAISTIFSTTIYVWYFVKILRDLKLSVLHVYFNIDELKQSAAVGFPNMLQQSMMYFCTTLISPLKNSSGASAMSGMSIGMKIYNLNAKIYESSNKVLSNYIAQCVGAGKQNKIGVGIKVGLKQTIMFFLPVLIVCVLGANYIPQMFFDDSSSFESIYYAKIFLKLVLPFSIFNMLNNTLHQIFRGAGSSRYLVASTTIYSVSNLVFSYTLYPKYGMCGIYVGLILAWISETIFGGIIYFSGKWKPKLSKEISK